MAASYPMSGKPKVFYRDGMWDYYGFKASTIPALIELVRLYFIEVPRYPILRDGGGP